MGLYTQIQKKGNKREIVNYEKIIQKINKYYDSFSAIYKRSWNIEYEEYLETGKSFFEFPLENYMNSSVVDDDFIELLNQADSKIKGYTSSKEIADKKIINALFDKLSTSNENTMTYIDKINYLLELDNDTLREGYSESLLLILASGVLPEYKNVLDTFKDKINKKTEEGKSILTVLSEIVEEEKIELNSHDILEALREKAIIKSQLKDKLKEKCIQNEFIFNTNRLKNKVKNELESGKELELVLKDILPEAYGLVKAACEYSLNKTPYDVQLMGAIALNEGKISEMYTGEGKTLTAILPAYLNALTGKEVDIFTSNDYLATRDANNNSAVFNLLGLTVGSVLVDGQTVKEKQKAYNSDIVYGSSTAFAFDFLYDTNEDDYDNIVQRNEKPGFVIVDEADQILINNALSPYQLKDGGKVLTKQQEKENAEVKTYLEKALELEKILSSKVYKAQNQYEYECITGDNKKETERMNEKYSLLIGFDDVYITQKGDRELFYNYMYDEIFDLSNRASEFIVNDSRYLENEDYILRNDKLVLTPIGVEKASLEIREFQDLKLKWLTDEKIQIQKRYVTNALRARYLMEKGKDYQVVKDEETDKSKIVILQDGRILPNSKFMNGLHEAIELKEGIGLQLEKNESLLDSALASISNRALLSRYDKVSGMTGTADKTAFYEIYNLDTFEVPKSKEYQYKKGTISEAPRKRKDNPTKLYKTDEAKFQAIIQDVVESHAKGQPVLVVTDNEEEAQKIYSFLETIPSLPLNLLTSDKSLQEEAKIISKAGMIGAVTIATEMAGRGTDIKLAGEKEESFETLKQKIILREAIDTKAEEYMELNRRQNTRDTIVKEEYIFAITELSNSSPKYLSEVVESLNKKYDEDIKYKQKIDDLITEEYNKTVAKVKEAGGLKYIQMNPFKTTRNDNQGRGRVARQGEPGETIMYSSINDLRKIGVDKEELNELENMFSQKTNVIDDSQFGGKVTDIIENAQLRNEFDIDIEIASTDTMDYAMSSLGISLLKDRKALLSTDDPTIIFENMIDSVIDVSLKENVPEKKRKKIDKASSRLSRLNLNVENLSMELKSIFGIDINKEEIFIECMDVGDLKEYLFDKAKEKQKENNLGVSEGKVNNNIKKSLINQVNETYNNFIYSAENVRLQELNDRIAQNSTHNRILELNNIYLECVQEGWKHCVQSVFRPNLKKEESYKQEVVIDDSLVDNNLPTIDEVTPKSK